MLTALAGLLLAASPGPVQAKDWAGLVGSAQRIYYVPLDATPYDTTLAVAGGPLSTPESKLRQTMAEAKVFEEFNAAALAALKAKLGEKVQPVPERFHVEKKKLFGKIWTYDWEAMDCDFYILGKLEAPGGERGAHFRISGIDAKERASYIPLMPDPVLLVFYHKPTPTHEGKRVTWAQADLLGPHKFQLVSGKTSAELIEETVEAEIAGRAPEYPVETYHFAWSKKHYAGQPDLLAAGFARHAAKLRARFRERLFSVIDGFSKELDKKLR